MSILIVSLVLKRQLQFHCASVLKIPPGHNHVWRYRTNQYTTWFTQLETNGSALADVNTDKIKNCLEQVKEMLANCKNFKRECLTSVAKSANTTEDARLSLNFWAPLYELLGEKVEMVEFGVWYWRWEYKYLLAFEYKYVNCKFAF